MCHSVQKDTLKGGSKISGECINIETALDILVVN